MMKFTATIEQGIDGTFTAVAIIGEHSVIGDGDTRDEALDDLRRGIEGLVDYLKLRGEPLPQSSVEIVSIDVAA